MVLLFASFSSAAALMQVGETAPDFSLKNTEGKTISLSQFNTKKAVVILFWSIGSDNSPKALKRFDEYYKKYANRDIQVIGINVEHQNITQEDRSRIREFAGELNVSFPVLIDEGLNTFAAYNVIAMPSTIVIKNGKVSYEMPGFPLMGVEEMFDYLITLAGDTPHVIAKQGYKPRYDAISDTNFAMEFVKKQRYEMAQPLFIKAIEKDPRYILPYTELAKLYTHAGKDSDAEDILRKALSKDPENISVMCELGYVLARTGKIKEAVDTLTGAVKSGATYAPAYYYLGYVFAADGKMKESFESFEKAASLSPDDSIIYSLRAEVYEKGKMFKEASSDYRKVIEKLLNIH